MYLIMSFIRGKISSYHCCPTLCWRKICERKILSLTHKVSATAQLHIYITSSL